MASLSCATLNVRGCRDSLKRYQVFDFLKQSHPADFYLLQETHSIPSDELIWPLVWRSKCILSHGTNNSAGIAILFSPKSKVEIIEKSEPIPGHILHAHATVNDTPVNIINIYAHCNAKERLKCFTKLNGLLPKLNEDPIILAGDFNCTLNPELDRQQCSESDPHTVRGLSNLISKHKLIDAWRHHHNNNRNYTWHRNDTKARLDRIYINKCLKTRIRTIAIQNASLAFSDHSLVKLTLAQKQIQKRNPVWCLNTETLKDDNYCQLISYFWGNWTKEKNNYANLATW